MASPIIVWFRQDFRLDDNPALAAAAKSDRPVLPVFVLDEGPAGTRPLGGAVRWWLHHSLENLGRDLKTRGAALRVARGPAAPVLADLCRTSGAATVVWNGASSPAAQRQELSVERQLRARSMECRSFPPDLLWEPGTILNRSGSGFRVFGAFWKALLEKGEPSACLPAPETVHGADTGQGAETLASLGLLPRKPDWAGGLRQAWKPGERGAHQRLAEFLDGPLRAYSSARDMPSHTGTSRLSPHLGFGEASVRRVWHTVAARAATDASVSPSAHVFLRELGWREFNHHMLHHHPHLPDSNLQARFDRMAWRTDPADLRAWQQGLTGYPLVDAGMRELWETGWMHNRVRMVAASFLVKHLLIDWRVGEAWFWDTLVDADIANNVGNWQWVAGSGADAAPFFRIFNPVLQGRKFDPDGTYVRRWVPELAKLPDRHVHEPWKAPRSVLADAGVAIGRDYPAPIVDHANARVRALRAFAALA